MIHQDCFNRYDLLHCHFHDSCTHSYFDGVYAETKKKKTYEQSITKNILSLRHAISLICQECMISLNSVSSFKLYKEDADTLKNFIETDLKNGLVTAS